MQLELPDGQEVQVSLSSSFCLCHAQLVDQPDDMQLCLCGIALASASTYL